jgi:hypothetical protein
MTATVFVVIIVMGLALFFLWPIPFFAILVIGAHPVFWAILAVALGLIVAALTYLRMQPDPFDEDNAERTTSSR